jgi:enoyl-CoA hydratase
VILTGAGDSFCAGADLNWVAALQDDDTRESILDEAMEIIFEMVRCPLPVIAAVNGPAITLGCSIAVMSDIVLIAENAYLADPHIVAGTVPGDGGAAMWPLLTNVLRVREYLFTGDRIPATLAVEVGLASRVVAGSELMSEAQALAARLAEVPRYALQDTKKAVNLHLAQALCGAVQTAATSERLSLNTDGHRERIAALLGSLQRRS